MNHKHCTFLLFLDMFSFSFNSIFKEAYFIDDVEYFNNVRNIDNPTFKELNIPISQSEVRNPIQNLSKQVT